MADLNLLRRALAYNHETGVFTWKISPSQSVKAGDVAGTVHPTGYIHIGYKRRIYRAHRLAWAFMSDTWPSSDIDHINGNCDDNRIVNLRIASDSENLCNRKLCTRNKSGVKGVHWFNPLGKWCAQIGKNGKRYHLGYFSSIEDAAKKVADERIRLHGEFANHGTR